MKVLVTDAGFKHTLGIIRSLGKAGIDVFCVGKRGDIGALSKYSSGIGFPSKYFDENHLDYIFREIKKRKYEVLLPVSATATEFVSRQLKHFQRILPVPIAEIEKIDFAFDKLRIAELSERIGVPSPKTYYDPSGKFQSVSSLSFPLVIKRRNELYNQPVKYANSIEEYEIIMNSWKGPPPIIQQFIDGVGCAFFALYDRGECKRIFMHKRVRENPPSGGPSCCAESIFEEDILQYGKKILDSLNWHGVAMVEFKRSIIDGKPYIMEVNPKFWGSLDIALQAGVNFPLYAVKMALGERIEFSDKYQVGLRYHWPLDGEISHFLLSPSSFREIFFDLFNPKVKSNIFFTDPVPHAFSSFYSLWNIIVFLKNWWKR
ncbi:MAG: ATP-grasp domain-containing protein [Candidatus Riflebacteria bacterium]|nr:ATP-grasp domain-containing protein [Candidatus Riflebacteria bacterium]